MFTLIEGEIVIHLCNKYFVSRDGIFTDKKFINILNFNDVEFAGVDFYLLLLKSIRIAG